MQHCQSGDPLQAAKKKKKIRLNALSLLFVLFLLILFACIQGLCVCVFLLLFLCNCLTERLWCLPTHYGPQNTGWGTMNCVTWRDFFSLLLHGWAAPEGAGLAVLSPAAFTKYDGTLYNFLAGSGCSQLIRVLLLHSVEAVVVRGGSRQPVLRSCSHPWVFSGFDLRGGISAEFLSH